ncbi:hypothetical protein GCM10022237_20230 [Nocardioides ginsengisoli]|uniref:Peptidoglycan-binding protein n=1 Tax=Nocardioides ginsengisoli TaxID=363868 RepID=A0ABW3W5E6_9ACTN
MARRKRSTWLVVAMGLVVIVGLGTFGLSTLIRSPADRLASTRPPEPTLLTAPVTSGSLRSPEVFAGRIRWPRLRAVVPILDPSRASVVTDRPAPVGRTLGAGAVLTEISDRPVFVLPGQVPMLRDLRDGDQGDDVARLQVALRAAGYGSTDTSGEFGTSSIAALTRLYADHGYELPRVGGDERAGYAARSELVFVPVLPATVVKLPYRLGDTVDGAVATLGIGQPIVTATVDAASVPEKGSTVDVAVKGRAQPWTGVVTKVGKRRVPEGGSAVVDVKVRLEESVPGSYVGSAVRISDRRRPPSGLLVPIAAVNSTTDGSLFVRTVKAGRESVVAIKVLETAVGAARVAPAIPGALAEGDDVVLGVAR